MDTHPSPRRLGLLRAADRLLAPLLLFVLFYLATFALLTWLRAPFVYWSAFAAVSVATGAAIAIHERGAWSLGLFVSPRLALREVLLGIGFGAALILICAALVVVSTEQHHSWSGGFPWRELAVIYLPAVVHEELLFRGYPFQKLYHWRRDVAIVAGAVVFALLHARNPAAGVVALTNIFLGGILLGLAYAAYERLWFPIGLHLAWNVTTGPVLGHEVSGYEPMQTLFVERGAGAWWWTGGEFGIEGSVWMTLVEVGAIALLLRKAYHPRALRLPSR